MIKGIFEVHIITTPEFQTDLFGYIADIKSRRGVYSNLIRPRPTCAHAKYGDYPVQPMLTFCLMGTTEKVRGIVDKVVEDMKENQIPIIRVKIEAAAHNRGVPEKCIDPDDYFEMHFKVPIKSRDEWNKLVRLTVPFGCHLFYNPYNKTLDPVLTIRRYSSLEELESDFEALQSVLVSPENNFLLGSIEKEYSVLDTDVGLDKNWLYRETPSNFIREVTSEMLF